MQGCVCVSVCVSVCVCVSETGGRQAAAMQTAAGGINLGRGEEVRTERTAGKLLTYLLEYSGLSHTLRGARTHTRAPRRTQIFHKTHTGGETRTPVGLKHTLIDKHFFSSLE